LVQVVASGFRWWQPDENSVRDLNGGVLDKTEEGGFVWVRKVVVGDFWWGTHLKMGHCV